MASVSAVSMSVELRERLRGCTETVNGLIKSIRAGQLCSTSPDAHSHTRLVETSQRLSEVCTKLALLFSKPPLPSLSECSVMCEGMEWACAALVGVYNTLEGGAVYREEVKMCVLSILEDLYSLLTTILNTSGQIRSELYKTGAVWRSCADVSKLSKSSQSAVVKVCLTQLQLLRDARTELTRLVSLEGACEVWEGLEEEPDTVAVWGPKELQLVRPASQLVETCVEVVECVARLLVIGGRKVGVTELDEGCGLIKTLSPAVDDLVNELEAPVSIETCRSMVVGLSELLLTSVQQLSFHGYCHHDNWTADKFTASINDSIQKLNSV